MEMGIRVGRTHCSAFELYDTMGQPWQSLLLDSSKIGPGQGTYSFIGFSPFLTLETMDSQLTLTGCGAQGYASILEGIDPCGERGFWTALDRLLKVLGQTIGQGRNQAEEGHSTQQATFPFIGGAMGYIGYDMMRKMYPFESRLAKDIPLPEARMHWFDGIVAVNELTGEYQLTAFGMTKPADELLDALVLLVARTEERCKKDEKVVPIPQVSKCRSPFTKDSYIAAVDRMRDYIRQGDLYIGNMTHTFTTESREAPWAVYQRVRRLNPAPYAAYINETEFQILCSSPERFLKISNRRVETRPIKGTRPRGKDAAEDQFQKDALAKSEKDRSELLMVVDLERNDLSKVCKPFGVKVTELFAIETYATVFHLVATIEGELDEAFSEVDCVREAFPGGSITGTPKLRTMEVIEALERNRRGIYTGCIGYFGYDGTVDLNIVIRTMVRHGEVYQFGVGGGITWESHGDEEYQETLDKAKAMVMALRTEVEDEYES